MRMRFVAGLPCGAAGACLLLATALGTLGILGTLWSGRVWAQEAPRPAGWNESTHGARVGPGYARLFAMDKVHDIRITMAPDRFRAMQADLAAIVPAGMGPGGRGMPPGPGRGADAMAAMMEAAGAACMGKAASAACTINETAGQCNAMFGGPLMCVPAAFANIARGGAPSLTTRDPMYVPVTVTHEGRAWTRVGMRYKGNSSLMAANAGGNGKVPFRLAFDQYEDEFPEISNQRFYGFQELTFSSNFSDDSQLREVLASEILRDRGVPAARAAFYRVFVDTGAGPEYWGLYTMIEDPADGAMLDAQLRGRNANLYKPDGPGANWSAFDKAGFEKKTNKQQADYSDVAAAIAALHAPRDNPRAWRAALEARLDVDLFLRWLAVNSVMENWDSYGVMAHNYYLYGDPTKGGRLQWIPWDHNMAFGVGPGMPGGRGPGRGGFGPGGPPPAPPGAAGARAGMPMPFGMGPSGADILAEQVGDTWPLIQRLMADEVYAARYRVLLVQAMGGLFAPRAIEKRARDLHALISSSVVGPRGERPTHTTIASAEAFERSLDGPDGLLQRIERRQAAVRAAIDRAGRR